jgi:hypothetical protein
MSQWSAKEAHEAGADLFEGRRDEPSRRVGDRQAILQLGKNGEMGTRRTAQAHVWSLAISRTRIAVR